jgi:hypothetical protein
MHQSVVELGTEICTSIANAREHVSSCGASWRAGEQGESADRVGRHASVFKWQDQLITEGDVTRKS